MKHISRRGVIALFAGAGGAAMTAGNGLAHVPVVDAAATSVAEEILGGHRFARMRALLLNDIGEGNFADWFTGMDFERFDGGTLTVSVALRFVRTWIEAHYAEPLRSAARIAYPGAAEVKVVLRGPPRISAADIEGRLRDMESRLALNNGRLRS